METTINVGWSTVHRFWPPETTLEDLMAWWRESGEGRRMVTLVTGGRR